MGLKGDLGSLKGMKASLKKLPVSLAHAVSKRAAPALTGLTTQAFHSNKTVYGDARPAGVDGNPLSLVKSGRTQRTLEFVANGTIVRCVLGTNYARYLIGKYGVLPNGARLPAEWSRKLGEIVSTTKVEP